MVAFYLARLKIFSTFAFTFALARQVIS